MSRSIVEISVLPPGWSQINGSGVHVVLALPSHNPLVAQLRAILPTGRRDGHSLLDDVIDILLQAGLRGLPDFVAVDEAEPVRLVIRGAPVAEVTVAGEIRSVVSGGARTWVDVEVTDRVELVRLSVPNAEPEPELEPTAEADLEPVADTEPEPESETAVEPAVPAAARRTCVPTSSMHALPSWPDEAPMAQSAISAPQTSSVLPVVQRSPPVMAQAVDPEVDDRQELPSYDDLFGSTQRVMAFHADDQPEQATDAVDVQPPEAPATAPATAPVTPFPLASELTLPPPSESTSSAPRPGERTTLPSAAGPTTHTGAPGLIASVPWAKPPSSQSAATARPVPRPGSGVLSPAPGVSFARPPAVPTPAPGPPVAVDPEVLTEGTDSDSDLTVDRSALLAAAQAKLTGPTVLAVLCPAGHPSPAHAGRCRICKREIPGQQPYNMSRPALGVLRLSTGDVVKLDRGVLLGRAPKITGDPAGSDRPHVLRLPSPDNDISRNHVEVVLEGWHVLVRDLGSTNGTTVALPGQEPIRLRPNDQQVIEPGTVVDLADEVSFTYEVQE